MPYGTANLGRYKKTDARDAHTTSGISPYARVQPAVCNTSSQTLESYVMTDTRDPNVAFER
jgi:hypothetical protein